MSALGSTLREWAVLEIVPGRTARRVVAVIAFVLATAAGAYVAVPLPWTPVPMTLQPLIVLLAGALLGPVLGAAAMAAYLAVGLVGAPVFSGGGAGLAWLAGPTGGYLIAFPAAAAVVGLLAGRGEPGTGRLLAGLVAGLSLMYLGGLSQLALLTGRGWGDLLAVGVLPFLGGDFVKVSLALVLARRLRTASLGRF